MIPLTQYSKQFEEEYYEAVRKKVGIDLQKKIIRSCEKYFPNDTFQNKTEVQDKFKALILFPYEDLKNIKENIDTKKMQEQIYVRKDKLKKIYQTYYNGFERVTKGINNGVKLNVRIVRESQLLTCPYCNRDYINCRGDKVSGAQLDHFYNRSQYPIFALSLYNLIPVCGNCNRVKSDKDVEIVSPFDKDARFNEDIYFKLKIEEYGKVQFELKGKGNFENNIKQMRIDEAYHIHNLEVQELFEKAEIYNKTQQEEIQKVLQRYNISNEEIDRLTLGGMMEPKDFGKKTLSKLRYEIWQQLRGKQIGKY